MHLSLGLFYIAPFMTDSRILEGHKVLYHAGVIPTS